jgi:hypothetical protein
LRWFGATRGGPLQQVSGLRRAPVLAQPARMKKWMLVLWAVGCATEPSLETETRVVPVELVMDERIVLTPGHTVRLPVQISRDDDHPVQLELAGAVAPGVTVQLSQTNTKETTVELEVAVQPTAVASDLAFTLTANLGPYRDEQAFVVSVQLPSPVDGTETYAPGVTGHVKTMTVMGEPITYEVINGVAVIGDIVLGDATTIEALANLRSATCNPNFHTDFACSAWQDGIIGYSLANDWGSHNTAMTAAIERAMAEWTRQTGIRFEPRTSGQFLQFRDGDGCSSTVGRAVFTGLDSQSISLNGEGCQDAVLHEIGHAIGLYHEHMRNDRNTYVDIRLSNIQSFKEGNFFRIGDFLVDRGRYNYQSVMHYKRHEFAKERQACKDGDDTKCTILPRFPEDAHDMGQRHRITEGDIYGVYRLYPPRYRIISDQSSTTADRFNLFINWDRGRPGAGIDRIVWSSNRITNPLGSGDRLFLRADMVPPGEHTITASFYVAGEVITSRSITLNFVNAAPQVTLATVNGSLQQHMGQTFSVRATIDDAEDGACIGCTLVWTPTPPFPTSIEHTAGISFDTPGLHTISVAVTDHGGRTSTASLTVNIVNTPPVVTITRPEDGLVLAGGGYVQFEATATDINGTHACSQVRWRSSIATDGSGNDSCQTTIWLEGEGTRTITVEVTDGDFVVTDSIQVTVTGCTADCPPDANLTLPPPHSPDGYFLDRELRFEVSARDIDGTRMTLRLFVRPVGSTTLTPIDVFVTDSGTSSGFLRTWFDWEPNDHVALWPTCVTEFRDYDIVYEVTDAADMTTTVTRRIRLGCELI